MPKVSNLINDTGFSQTLSSIARDIVTFEINNDGFQQSELNQMKDVLISAWTKLKNNNQDTEIQKAKAALLLIAAHSYLVTNKQTNDDDLLKDVEWMYQLTL